MMETQCNSTSPLDIEDIEDLFDLPYSDVSKAGANSSLVVPKVKKRVKKGIIIQDQVKAQIKDENKDATEKCFLPGILKLALAILRLTTTLVYLINVLHFLFFFENF